ncbi:uncharacterized protein LOC120104845 [Phoenix dactylifera]|uniref:Uncharacterized protein LOC120104845 n=1 Tax=Phoenix dactylifera TaxID=42345 RepID=A0A8B8ZMC7_PHODC|nr:uncharacterized protein LOC120104845 [Phoenix dactylifera]
MPTLAYLRWLGRNTWVFDGESLHPRLVADRALRLAAEIIGASEAYTYWLARDIWGPPFCSAASRTILVSWVPPPPGFLKVNFDGSVSVDGSCGGVGFIIRDHDARLVAAGGRRIFDLSVATGRASGGLGRVSPMRGGYLVRVTSFSRGTRHGIAWIREGGTQSRTGRCFTISVERWGRTVSYQASHVYREANGAADWVASFALITREIFFGRPRGCACVFAQYIVF